DLVGLVVQAAHLELDGPRVLGVVPRLRVKPPRGHIALHTPGRAAALLHCSIPLRQREGGIVARHRATPPRALVRVPGLLPALGPRSRAAAVTAGSRALLQAAR